MLRPSISRNGVSLIEVVIVIFIVCLLLQLLLPAIGSSREAARRTACANNLRQLSTGVNGHLTAFGCYPSGGWGSTWVGDPDRGTGPDQPGSWAYNILDFVEQADLREQGRGLAGDVRLKAVSAVCETPVPLFYCPTRRTPQAYIRSNSNGWITIDGTQQLSIEHAARSDYAINTGDLHEAQVPGNRKPKSYAEAESPTFNWFDTSAYVGISYGRSRIEPRHIVDGLSKTYMLGEKFVPTAYYFDGQFKADNECVYSGFDNDNGRSAKNPPRPDTDFTADYMGPRQHINDFGSAHPDIWQVALCDGSVLEMSYNLDPTVHKQFGNREDENAMPQN